MSPAEEQPQDVGAEARRELDELDSSDEMQSQLESLDEGADDVDLPGMPDPDDVGSGDEAAESDGDEENGDEPESAPSDDDGGDEPESASSDPDAA